MYKTVAVVPKSRTIHTISFLLQCQPLAFFHNPFRLFFGHLRRPVTDRAVHKILPAVRYHRNKEQRKPGCRPLQPPVAVIIASVAVQIVHCPQIRVQISESPYNKHLSTSFPVFTILPRYRADSNQSLHFSENFSDRSVFRLPCS